MKPDNICIGAGKTLKTFYLIDFGLSKRYVDPQSGKHIAAKEGKGIIGTAAYLSKNAGNCFEHARRDDMESLGYILIYFMRGGKLPWSIYKMPEPPGVFPEDSKREYVENLQF
jgi:serine/threonine protein kinase